MPKKRSVGLIRILKAIVAHFEIRYAQRVHSVPEWATVEDIEEITGKKDRDIYKVFQVLEIFGLASCETVARNLYYISEEQLFVLKRLLKNSTGIAFSDETRIPSLEGVSLES